MVYLWVALGSAAGGTLRFALSTLGTRLLGGLFPWWTLSINVIGCFLIGFIAAQAIPQHIRTLLVPGFCGGFTTFSAFSLEFLILQREQRHWEAWVYVAASVVLCLLAVQAGTFLGKRV
jgi:CrcB protein